MNQDSNNTEWPEEAGDPESLPTEAEGSQELEDRVVTTLLNERLIQPDQPSIARHPGWRVMRAALATAAGLTLVAIGGLAGRLSAPDVVVGIGLTGSATDLYALLLYETDGYDPPSGDEAVARYGEYNQWVAEARRRAQFVGGEDLEVDRGWLLVPEPDGPSVRDATNVADGAALSGLFFIRAQDADQALALARELPHLRHGGRVLVQKTIPTDAPPAGR